MSAFDYMLGTVNDLIDVFVILGAREGAFNRWEAFMINVFF